MNIPFFLKKKVGINYTLLSGGQIPSYISLSMLFFLTETMGGRRKKLSQGNTTSSQTKFLEIQCKVGHMVRCINSGATGYNLQKKV